MLAGKAEPLATPQTYQNRQRFVKLLGMELLSILFPEPRIFAPVVPTNTGAKDEPATGKPVYRNGLASNFSGTTTRQRSYQRTEADALRGHSNRSQAHPGIGHGKLTH